MTKHSRKHTGAQVRSQTFPVISSSKQFDWDADYSDLIANSDRQTPAAPAPEPATQSKAAFVLHGARRYVAPLGFCGLFLAAVAFEKFDTERFFSDVASDLRMGTAVMAVPWAEMLPPELQVYDQHQFRRFSQGLQRMTTPDLLSYKASLRRDLRAAPSFMAPLHGDALFLLKAEIARRGQ